MNEVVIFGVGSSLAIDIDESIRRAGMRLRAAIRNRPGTAHVLPDSPVVELADAPFELRSLPYLLPMFTPGQRMAAAREAAAAGFEYPCSLIDPSVPTVLSLTYGDGLYVNAGCVLGGGSSFKDFVHLNRGACIGHHAQLAEFVSIGPGAVLAGEITVDRGAVIAAGATILPKITIGSNSVVAAGAVVTRNVPPNCIVAGNPARIVRDTIPGYQGLGVP